MYEYDSKNRTKETTVIELKMRNDFKTLMQEYYDCSEFSSLKSVLEVAALKNGDGINKETFCRDSSGRPSY